MTAQCPECEGLARELQRWVTRAQQATSDRQNAERVRDEILKRMTGYEAELQKLRASGGDAKAIQAAQARLAELNRVLPEQTQRIAELAAQEQVARDRADRFAKALAECNATCGKSPPPIDQPPVRPDPPPISEPPAIEIPSVKCEPCERPSEEAGKLQQERARLGAEAARLKAELQKLRDQLDRESAAFREAEQAVPPELRLSEGESRRRFAERNRALVHEIMFKEEHIIDTQQRIQSIDRALLPQAIESLERCNESCPLDRPNRWRLTLPLGGAAILGGALLNGGDDAPTPTTPSPPVTTPAPSAMPPPPPVTSAPMPAPPPVTATGSYLCVACAVQSDASRHDLTLRVCSGVTSAFSVMVGSLTIRHPSPFIDVTGASYNAETGAFDLSGRGSIAGFSNVTVRATGTANASTGRITMTYTMGTAGEFPGGQPITYALTLQRQ